MDLQRWRNGPAVPFYDPAGKLQSKQPGHTRLHGRYASVELELSRRVVFEEGGVPPVLRLARRSFATSSRPLVIGFVPYTLRSFRFFRSLAFFPGW